MSDVPEATGAESPRAATTPVAGSPGRSRRPLVVLFVVFFALLGVGAVARATSPERTEDGWHGTYLPQPMDRPSFTLTATDGSSFDFHEQTSGELTFLFFGYANCPDICPITLATLAAALDASPGLASTVVFVSVDPERDPPEELRAYLDRFDSSFIGLTGTEDELVAAQTEAGVSAAMLDEPDDDGSYEVGHAARVLVYTPDDLSHLSYAFGVLQAEWVSDLSRLRDQDAWWEQR